MSAWKKVVLIVLGMILVVVSMCPTAFAVSTVSANCSQPSTDGDDGYIEYLVRRGDGIEDVLVFSWQVLNHFVDSSSSTQSNDLQVSLAFNITGNTSGVTFNWASNVFKSILVTVVYRDVINYYAIAGYGQNIDINPLELLYTVDSNARIKSCAVHSSLNLGWVDYNPDSMGELPSFVVTYGADSAINKKLTDVVTFLVSTYLSVDNIDKDIDGIDLTLEEINAKLAEMTTTLNEICWLVLDIDNLVYGIYEYLDTTLNYHFGVVYDYLNMIRFNTADTVERLDIIIELLKKSGQFDFSDPDTSNIDDYYDVENSLLDNSNVDSSSAISIEVDQNAMAVIWDIVNAFLNIHPAVIGLVITILSLSLIALILGR